MEKAKNKVIAGDYNGKPVVFSLGTVAISNDLGPVQMNSSTVEFYELITDERRKSAASGVARGLVGGALLEPVGMLAKSQGVYQVAVLFKDGKRSLLEVDDTIYKALIKSYF